MKSKNILIYLCLFIFSISCAHEYKRIPSSIDQKDCNYSYSEIIYENLSTWTTQEVNEMNIAKSKVLFANLKEAGMFTNSEFDQALLMDFLRYQQRCFN